MKLLVSQSPKMRGFVAARRQSRPQPHYRLVRADGGIDSRSLGDVKVFGDVVIGDILFARDVAATDAMFVSSVSSNNLTAVARWWQDALTVAVGCCTRSAIEVTENAGHDTVCWVWYIIYEFMTYDCYPLCMGAILWN